MSDQEKRDSIVEGLIPKQWDKGPYYWALTVRDFLTTIAGVRATGSGTGFGEADCSFDVEGESFLVIVKRLPSAQNPSVVPHD